MTKISERARRISDAEIALGWALLSRRTLTSMLRVAEADVARETKRLARAKKKKK